MEVGVLSEKKLDDAQLQREGNGVYEISAAALACAVILLVLLACGNATLLFVVLSDSPSSPQSCTGTSPAASHAASPTSAAPSAQPTPTPPPSPHCECPYQYPSCNVTDRSCYAEGDTSPFSECAGACTLDFAGAPPLLISDAETRVISVATAAMLEQLYSKFLPVVGKFLSFNSIQGNVKGNWSTDGGVKFHNAIFSSWAYGFETPVDGEPNSVISFKLGWTPWSTAPDTAHIMAYYKFTATSDGMSYVTRNILFNCIEISASTYTGGTQAVDGGQFSDWHGCTSYANRTACGTVAGLMVRVPTSTCPKHGFGVQ